MSSKYDPGNGLTLTSGKVNGDESVPPVALE